MLRIQIIELIHSLFLIDQTSIVNILAIIVLFFLALLILVIRESFLLNKENERLSKSQTLKNKKSKLFYKDFREGHLYERN
ncbi:hypothetical protein BZARG_03155 [Bizionia argentinensis JUB59]|uniref:Uncharacterized protein n=1 Tax=Bizionia argentinensis JUB59 TaxID=1046627 RepID=A0A4V6I6W0_9FLAO|nr:hypothetical protein BZARG_03155 [Bizionia argentinensis JUB59]